MNKPITFPAGSETLAGDVILSIVNPLPQLLFLHGAGTSNRYRALYLAELLKSHEITSLTFDFSGHGKSSGEMNNSSLAKRTNEALEAVKLITHPNGVSLVGSSMGGYTALDLLDKVPVKNLILFAPAVYADTAYSVNFSPDFTKIIRKPGSWKNSRVWKKLQNFKVKLLIIIGEDDGVIPKELIELLDKNSPQVAKKKILHLPGVTHAIHTYISEYPAVIKEVVEEIVDLLS